MALSSKARTKAVLILKNSILAELDDEVHGLASEAIDNAIVDMPKAGQKASFNFNVTVNCDLITKALEAGRLYAKARG